MTPAQCQHAWEEEEGGTLYDRLYGKEKPISIAQYSPLQTYWNSPGVQARRSYVGFRLQISSLTYCYQLCCPSERKQEHVWFQWSCEMENEWMNKLMNEWMTLRGSRRALIWSDSAAETRPGYSVPWGFILNMSCQCKYWSTHITAHCRLRLFTGAQSTERLAITALCT